MEKSAFASSVVSEEEASLRGQSPRVEVGKGRYRSYRHDGGNSGGSRFSRRYVERSGGWIARGSARRGPGGDAPLSSIARCAKIASSSSTWTSFLALPMVLAGSVSRSGSGRGVSDAGRRLGMPFSIRLGNRNPDGNRAPRRVGGGFVEPELDGRGTFGGSRRGTHRARVGGACVRLCGSNAARDARLDSWTKPRHHRRHVFRFFQQKMRYLCMRIQSHETELRIRMELSPLFSHAARTFRRQLQKFHLRRSSIFATRGGARRISSCDVADRSVARAPARVTLAPARAGQGRAVDRHRSLR